MISMRKKLVELISESLAVSAERVNAVDDLAELEIDSLGLIDLITFVETSLSIRIPNERLDGIETLDDFVLAVEQSMAYEKS